jgi:hypothetical protein
MHSLLKNWKQNFFSKKIKQKNLNLKIFLNFIYVYNIIHHKKKKKKKKNQPKIPSTILVLKYICKISNFVMNIILSQIYTIN